jgi:hypothetical protein
MDRLTYIFFALACLFAAPVLAVDELELEEVPEPPVLPDPVESGEVIEPEVTIIRRKDAIIEEYRVNGNLYMIKITPAVGKPYYLVDRDGDGRMESRLSQIYNDILVPQWVLFRW